MKAKQKILILAGTHEQAQFIARKTKLAPQDWINVSMPEDVWGLNDCELWLFGSYEERRNYLEIMETCLSRGFEVRHKV